MLGPGEIDVAMLLGLFTPNELRRVHEDDLIDDYLRHSRVHGRELDKSRFMEGYRLGLIYALIHQINLSNIGLSLELWSWMFRNIQKACIDDVREIID